VKEIRRCCGAKCEAVYLEPLASQPCWGDVDVVAEDYENHESDPWHHACSGHADVIAVMYGAGDRGEYRSAPEGCTTVRTVEEERRGWPSPG
jgi:hypothetical protein